MSESPVVTAIMPEAVSIMVDTLDLRKSIHGCLGLISSWADLLLKSVWATSIPSQTVSSEVGSLLSSHAISMLPSPVVSVLLCPVVPSLWVPEVLLLLAVLPVIDTAILCVWATHCAPDQDKVVASTPDPPWATVFIPDPPELSACPVTTTKVGHVIFSLSCYNHRGHP